MLIYTSESATSVEVWTPALIKPELQALPRYVSYVADMFSSDTNLHGNCMNNVCLFAK